MVEDNLLNQLVTERILTDWGIQVDIANHGKHAIEMLPKGNYDLILMDLQMPVMNGYDTTRYIRNKMPVPYSKIPIIALTANAFSGMDDECMKIGMNDYISKPFEKDVLFVKIKSCLLGDDSAAWTSTEPTQQFTSMPIFRMIDLTYLRGVSGEDTFILNLAINKYLEIKARGLF